MAEIEAKVKAIIADKLGVEESQITNEANFQTDLGADSLDTVEMIMEFEKEFNVEIPAKTHLFQGVFLVLFSSYDTYSF